MASTTITAAQEIVPYVGLPEVDRIKTGLPWGKCVHRGNEVVSSPAQGDQLQVNFPLPTNFVARLTKMAIYSQDNSVNQWIGDPHLRVYYNPIGSSDFPNAFTTMEYCMVAGANPSIGSDPKKQLWYSFGQQVVAGVASITEGAVSSPMAFPTLLFTSIPAGVGTQEPAFRVYADDPGGGGSVNYIAEWDLFTIEQRNHVAVNTHIPIQY